MKKIIFVLLASSLVACGSDETADTNLVNLDSTNVVPDDPSLKRKVEAIEKIFYAIPSPMQTIDIIEEAGAVYDVQLTNDPENRYEYTEKTERALNMGVYGADVNYCSAFGKTADVLLFLACTRSLGDQLGLESVFDQNKKEETVLNETHGHHQNPGA